MRYVAYISLNHGVKIGKNNFKPWSQLSGHVHGVVMYKEAAVRGLQADSTNVSYSMKSVCKQQRVQKNAG